MTEKGLRRAERKAERKARLVPQVTNKPTVKVRRKPKPSWDNYYARHGTSDFDYSMNG